MRTMRHFTNETLQNCLNARSRNLKSVLLKSIKKEVELSCPATNMSSRYYLRHQTLAEEEDVTHEFKV